MTDIINKSGHPRGAPQENRSNRPLLAQILKEINEQVSAREHFRTESIQSIRKTIISQNFFGTDKIEVIVSKENPDEIIIKTKDASMSLSFSYDENQEVFDSLRKGVLHPPSRITLGANAGGEYHIIADGTIEDLGKLSGEILKHIERKKYPERFGFEKIQYIFENQEIFLLGVKNGKTLKIPFFEDWNDETRIASYTFLASYFGKPIRLREGLFNNINLTEV